MLMLLKTAFMWLLGMFSFALPEILRRIMGFLGLGLITMTGLGYLEGQLVSMFQAQLAGLPATVLAFLGIMKVDKAFSLLISAYGVKKLLNGISAAGTKKTYGRTGDPWSAPSSSPGTLIP